MSAPIDGPAEQDTPMTGTYALVLIVEVIILLALWIFGRLFV